MRRLVLALIAAPVLYVLAGFVGAMIPGPRAEVAGAPTGVIGLARGPIHYDILLPLDPETRDAFGFAQAQGLPLRDPRAEWLVVGWGAAGFYTTVGAYSDIRAPVLWRAVTGDSAVMRLDLAGEVHGVAGLQWVGVSPAQIEALRQALLAGFSRDAAGQVLPLPPAPWGQTHVFYQAEGRFNIFHTCNAWLGEVLRAAGIRFGLWTPTTQAVNLSLWLHG